MPDAVTIVDIGSNSVSVARYGRTAGAPERLAKASARMQLYLQLDVHGDFPPSVAHEAVETLRGLLAEVGAGNLPTFGVATSAVRDARNGAAFINVIRYALGIDLRIIDGPEEAALAAEAVVAEGTRMNGIVMDLGGGSLQLARLEKGMLIEHHSLPLGTLRVNREYLAHDPPTPSEVASLRAAVRASLATIAVHPRDAPIGVGGTVRALGKLARDRGARKDLVPIAILRAIVAELLALEPAARAAMRGLPPHRADTILPGALVIETVLTAQGFESLAVSGAGVRDGLAARRLTGGACDLVGATPRPVHKVPPPK